MARRLITVAFVWFAMQVLWSLMLAVPQPLVSLPHGLPKLALSLAPPLMLAGIWLRRALRARVAPGAVIAPAVATRSGFRLVPAQGDSAKGAIIVLEENPAAVPAAEVEFATEQIFASDEEWTVTRQALSSTGGALLDVVTFQSSTGQTRQLYFDVSRSKLFS